MAKQDKERNIHDFLKPQRGKVQQGYFTPQNPHKYRGELDKIIYRSSWELKFLQYCDTNDLVVEYGSEPLSVPYWNPLTKKQSNYWIDCYMMTRDPKGNTTKWLIEIKPNKYLVPPEEPKRLTEKATLNYARHAKAYIVNESKFKAAKLYAKVNHMRFGIITENFLFN
jgi:hypothetical protein